MNFKEMSNVFARIAIVLAVMISMLTSASLLAADTPPPAIAKRGAPVALGDMAPDFTLEDQDGRAVALSAEWKKRPLVLIFYRGYW